MRGFTKSHKRTRRSLFGNTVVKLMCRIIELEIHRLGALVVSDARGWPKPRQAEGEEIGISLPGMAGHTGAPSGIFVATISSPPAS